MSSLLKGASQVQGTFLGFGERCGNANLSAVIPNLQIKLGIDCIPQEKLAALLYCQGISGSINLDLSANLPYVGRTPSLIKQACMQTAC